jgi:Tol biopolymer transport system component
MIGKTFSHYKILEELGAGGMGIVYKAEDTKLGRTVALKFLPAELTRGAKHKQRFVREAQAASAMDHSNICTIYEIDETEDGRMFICMAYYEGQNLKEKIENGPLEIKEAVNIATQIAQGLAKAHAQEIVHRDVKPANIFVTEDGEAKILDFGLAKPGGHMKITSTGKTPGTLAYMSPEQVQGATVGARTDIWALGVVLYEMVTGQHPFRAGNEAAVLYSILNNEPAQMASLRPETPTELENIVAKATAKEPENRYAEATDLLEDLSRLKRELEISEHPVSQTWKFDARGRKWFPLVLVLSAVFVAAIAITIKLTARKEQHRPILSGQPLQVTSGDAWESEPALSPDGGRIAYASDISGNRDIYIIDARGGNPLRLTNDTAADYYPAWFPDGSALAFVSDRGGETSIWKIGQLGGGATLLIRGASDPAISPDGKRIAFCMAPQGVYLRIAVAPLADPNNITTLTGDDDGYWNHRSPAWSPEGRTICYSTQHDLWTIPASGGRAQRLTAEGKLDANPAWSSNNRHVYFSSYREGTLALWRVAVQGGVPERLTMGTGHEQDPTVCANGSRLAYATQANDRDLYIKDLESGNEVKLEGLRDDYLAAMAPDRGMVAYASYRVGPDADIWIQTLEQGLPRGSPHRLTDQPGDESHPVFSPDGKWIAYYRVFEERRDIWTIPTSGGQPNQFTEHPDGDYHPAWSPDGSMIAFVSEREGGSGLWTAPVENGERTAPPRRLALDDITVYAPVWSPDGSFIAFIGMKDNLSDVWLISPDGVAPVRQVTSGANARRVRWESTTGVIMVSGIWGEDLFTLRRVSLEDGQLVSVDPIVVFGSKTAAATFDVSRDGRLLVYCREQIRANIWMLEAANGTY